MQANGTEGHSAALVHIGYLELYLLVEYSGDEYSEDHFPVVLGSSR